MGKFGGQTKFGSGHFGGDRYPTTPGYIISRMVAAMSGFVSAGQIHTVARLYGDPAQAATWDAVLTPGGVPAVLVHYERGEYQPVITSGAVFEKTMTFAVYCFSGDYRDFQQRYEGKHSVDAAVENITAWAAYAMQRTLDGLSMRNARPIDERPFVVSPNVVGYVVRFTGTIGLDVYDDAISRKFESLGICHDPTDPNSLFEDDNVTPRSGEPVLTPNVADLTE